jgi:hypothetical protein
MKKMEYQQFSPDEWDRMCEILDTTTFYHTSLKIAYDMEFAPGWNRKNLSFVLLQDRKVIAVVPLYVEQDNGIWQMCNAGQALSGPALPSDMGYHDAEKTLKTIFEMIDGIAVSMDVKKLFFQIDPLANPASRIKWMNYNYLLKFGFIDQSLNSQILDLSLPESELWKQVRKGHKYDINQGRKHFQVFVYDSKNITEEIFENYRLLHHKAAGRVTRPMSTFKLNYEWIKAGKGLLVGVKYKDRFVGLTLVWVYKNLAYYASAADDPDAQVPAPIGHLIQWTIIEYLKANRVEFYDIGWQQFGKLPYDDPSEKKINISRFKRGFGGYTVPAFRGLKELT